MSKLAIDDILNANDSDEDIDTNSVDLEQLLDDNDSDDDQVILPTKALKPKQTIDSILDEDHSNQNKMEELFLALGGSENLPDVIDERPFTPTKFELPEESTPGSQAESSKAMTLLSTLELADRREQRLVKSGDREGMSALQAKLSGPKDDTDLQSLFQLKCSSLETISSQLSRNAQFRQHGPGTATVVQISSKFIAVGTTRGLVLLFDHAQEMRQVIGSSIAANSRNSTPVTALDVSTSSDSLFCGHENGELIIWETAKGTILKRISDLHSTRVVRFSVVYGIGESPNTTNGINSDYSLVSVDQKGVVMKSKLSKVLFLAISVESECLLDGTAGVVLDMCPLPPYMMSPHFRNSDFPQSCPLRVSEQLVALNSETRTYIIRVYPEVSVLNRWPAPQEIFDGKSGVIRPGFVVSLDWFWGYSFDYPVLKSRALSGRNGVNFLCPLLIRGWGRTIQLYACCVPPLAQAASQTEVVTINSEAQGDFISLGETIFDENTSILSVRWLGMNTVVALTNQEVYVIRVPEFTTDRIPLITPMATLLSSSLERKGLDDPLDISIAVAKQRMYLLSPENMFVFYVQSWREQIDQLVGDGQWLDALTLVLDRYSKSGGRNRRTNEMTPKSSTADEVTSADMEVYIRRYADMAVVRQQGSIHSGKKNNLIPGGGYATGPQHHYFLVAAVCIEFCILAGGQLMNVLFEEIYHTFTSAHQQTIFIESLEPFILRRQIRDLPPSVYLDFLDYGIRSRKFAFLERCVSFFDLVDIDIDATVRILLKQELISGFLYVYSYGLLDYAGAFQLVYEHMIIKQGAQPALEFPSPEQTDIGYKLLLFIQYTSQNRVFPRGDKLKLPSTALASLVRLLLSPAILPPITGSSRLEMQLEQHPLLMKTFPYLFALAKIDFYALFYCLQLCLIELYNFGAVMASNNIVGEEPAELPYGDLLYSALLFAKFGDTDLGMKNTLQRCFYEHLLDHIVLVTAMLPEPFLRDIIFHCKFHIKPHSAAEKLMFSLVTSQSKNIGSFASFAATLEGNGFYFPALRLYGGRLKPTHDTLGKALQSYISDRSEESRLKVFDYIQEFFSKLNHSESMSGESSDNRLTLCRSVLISHIEELATVSLLQTKWIIITYLHENISEIMEKTQKQQRLQFELLDALVRGVSVAEGPDQDEASSNYSMENAGILEDLFTPQQTLIYISQLATFRPSDLYSFLTTHHNYPLDDVLKLCRSKNIFDSTAFLLERAGDFQAALELCLTEIALALLQTVAGIEQLLSDQPLEVNPTKAAANRRGSRNLVSHAGVVSSEDVLSILKHAGNHHVSTGGHVYGLSSPVLEPVKQLDGFKSFSLAISTATGLCTRHDSKSNSTHWFKVLDFLLKEKHTLVMNLSGSRNLNAQKSREEISRDIAAIIVGYALKDFMGHMSSHVPSQDIVRRITQEQILGSRFAEFKDVMISMVESYAYEVSLYKTYLKINTHDILQLRAQRMKQKHKGLRHSGNIQSLIDSTPEGEASLSNGVHLLQDDEKGEHEPSLEEPRPSLKFKGKPSKSLMHKFKMLQDTKGKKTSFSCPMDTVVPTVLSDNWGTTARRVPGSLPQAPKFQAIYGC